MNLNTNFSNAMKVHAKINLDNIIYNLGQKPSTILSKVFLRNYVRPFEQFSRYLNYQEFYGDDEIQMYIDFPDDFIMKGILNNKKKCCSAVKVLPFISGGYGNGTIIDLDDLYTRALSSGNMDLGTINFTPPETQFEIFDENEASLYHTYIRETRTIFRKSKTCSIEFNDYVNHLPYIKISNRNSLIEILRLDFILFFYSNCFTILNKTLFMNVFENSVHYTPFSLAPFEKDKDLHTYEFQLYPASNYPNALPSKKITLADFPGGQLKLSLRKKQGEIELYNLNRDAKITDLELYGLTIEIKNYLTGESLNLCTYNNTHYLTDLIEDHDYIFSVTSIIPKNYKFSAPVDLKFSYTGDYLKYKIYISFDVVANGMIEEG